MTEKIIKELYNGEVKIDFYPESHRYKLVGQKTYLISTTAATSIIDKSRLLIGWAINLAGSFIKQYFENAKTTQFTAEELLPVIDEALKQHEVKKEEAASIGSTVHDWAEKFANAKLLGTEMPNLSEEMDGPVLAGVMAFLDWYNAHSIKFKATERMLYSKQYQYVGIADAVAMIDGKWILVDYKTGKRIYNEHFYQLSAYWGAYEEETGEKLDGALILHFNKETGEFNKREITREEHELNYPIFLACLTIKKREKELTKYGK